MTIYVSANVEKSGDGSRNHPFLTIQEAADIALPGDVVLVGEGIYREHVRPVNSGTREEPIVYAAAAGHKTVISGAEEITFWEPGTEEGVYRCAVGNGIVGS